MSNDVVEKTRKTAALYFDGWEDERPYSLWQSFDRERAADFSLFITGKLYAREKIPHRTRQLVAVAGLAALERTDELKLHLH
ncbi:MAG TPA: 4-carboxymuconolactone decarboxylase, partial [Thermodesulfobacteriota bacterium]|nr:4-carboxymuconolactone decarboxylase [Thermodesulfobacteriota bacterium]